MNRSTTIVRNNSIETAEIDGEIGMLNVESGQYFMLNGIGTDIWKLMGNPIAVGALVDQLLEIYTVDSETCEAETIDYLKDLKSKGLVTLVD